MLSATLPAFLPGFLLGLSLIVAIGAQNAFVLRQGLRGEHVMAVCLACALSDAALILAGVGGFAQAADRLPWLETATRYGGAAFLYVYGLRSLHAAFRADGALVPADAAPSHLGPTLATCLALTWLNPHVYLDTVVLIGSVSTQFAGAEGAFAAGAMTASFVFFFALGYGARLLRPVFARPGAWRALELVIAIVMCTIATTLLA
ncbi:LysE/ArgO family amino acid transporter [Azospirillum oleiclasticum]|uniref:LysE/ArgO family amino acid transporter n=1 Tax=Azospirillum oleiclasticum TaxID=2735135 RepID=UPI001FE59E3B|nr:LysE/ArgO family amino acid transporter [Azospirillum oleiclasticum]